MYLYLVIEFDNTIITVVPVFKRMCYYRRYDVSKIQILGVQIKYLPGLYFLILDQSASIIILNQTKRNL